MAASRGEHARLTPGTVVNNRYHVLHEMGCGNFSKVYAARDNTVPASDEDAIVALKLLKREYAHDAKFENDILSAVTKADPKKQQKVLRLKDHFHWNRYPCFVFERKGSALKSCKMGLRSNPTGCSRDDIRRFARQMLEALSFLHFNMKLVHTDLKPDNILVDAPPPVPTGVPSGNSHQSHQEGIGKGWTIADFGSASFYRMDKLDCDLISTRPYRAPEVIMGKGWYWPADMWSFGCILYEVYTGSKLFDVNDDFMHLSLMEQRLGKLPQSLTMNAKNSRRFYDGRGVLIQKFNAGRVPSKIVKSITTELEDDPQFADLILQMLQFEPSQRIRADDALKHPFLMRHKEKSPSPQASRRAVAMDTAAAVHELEKGMERDLHIRTNNTTTSSSNNKKPSTTSVFSDDKENAGLKSGSNSRQGSTVPQPVTSYPTINAKQNNNNNQYGSRHPPSTVAAAAVAVAAARPGSPLAATIPLPGTSATTAAVAAAVAAAAASPAPSTSSSVYPSFPPSVSARSQSRYALGGSGRCDPSQLPAAGRATGVRYGSFRH